jgi:transposase-like protein
MISKKFCPNCGSTDVFMIAGGTTGTWKCKECGFTGAVFEKEIIGKEMKKSKEIKK